MPDRPSADLRAAYGDILDSDDDLQLIRLVRDLDRAYEAEPPRELRGAGLSLHPHGNPARRRLPHWPNWNRTTTLLVGLALFAVISGAVLAAQAITNLGKQTNALSPNARFPLGGFRKYDKPLRSRSRYELLFIASGWPYDRVETWPVVKALDQFGTLSGVRPIERWCVKPPGSSTPSCMPPGFDLAHARYQSSYVRLAYHQLLAGADAHCAIHPTAYEARLLRHFHLHYGLEQGTKQKCWWVPNGPPEVNPLPLVLVGGYVQANLEIIKLGDFSTYATTTTPNFIPAPSGLPFATIQSDLQKGIDPPNTTLNEDVDAEANVMTTLICHADGGKPKSVCSRPAIRKMMKYVK